MATTKGQPLVKRYFPSVAFNRAVEIRPTTALCDYSEEERAACFISDQDWFGMRERAKRAVIRARRAARVAAKYRKTEATSPLESDGGDDRCDDDDEDLRGLEHLFDPSVMAKKEKRRIYVRAAVLLPPKNGAYNNCVDSLARASKSATSKASREAAEMGAMDAAVAAKIHAESIRDDNDPDDDERAPPALLCWDACGNNKANARAAARERLAAALSVRSSSATSLSISTRNAGSSWAVPSLGETTTASTTTFSSSSSLVEATSMTMMATMDTTMTVRSAISSLFRGGITAAQQHGGDTSNLKERLQRRERIIDRVVVVSPSSPPPPSPPASAASTPLPTPFEEDEDAAALLGRLRSLTGPHEDDTTEPPSPPAPPRAITSTTTTNPSEDAAKLLERIRAIAGRAAHPSPSPSPEENMARAGYAAAAASGVPVRTALPSGACGNRHRAPTIPRTTMGSAGMMHMVFAANSACHHSHPLMLD